MPIYVYHCTVCYYDFELIHSHKIPGPTHCPACNEETLVRPISKSTFVLKGTGWEKDGYVSTKKTKK